MIFLSRNERKLIIGVPTALALFAIIYWIGQNLENQPVLTCHFPQEFTEAWIQYHSKTCNAMQNEIFADDMDQEGREPLTRREPLTKQLKTYLDGYSKLGLLLLSLAVLWCVWIFFDEVINGIVSGVKPQLGLAVCKPDTDLADYVHDSKGQKDVMAVICLLLLSLVPRLLLFLFQCSMLAVMGSFSNNFFNIDGLKMLRTAVNWKWLWEETSPKPVGNQYFCDGVVNKLGKTHLYTFQCTFIKSVSMNIGDQLFALAWFILFTSLICVIFGFVAMGIKVLVALFTPAKMKNEELQTTKTTTQEHHELEKEKYRHEN